MRVCESDNLGREKETPWRSSKVKRMYRESNSKDVVGFRKGRRCKGMETEDEESSMRKSLVQDRRDKVFVKGSILWHWFARKAFVWLY
jgi:hypothetical protein